MGSTEIGPGAVIGLAEGIADIPSSYDIVANNTVNTKLINIEKAVREVTSLNSGLKGICRSTIMLFKFKSCSLTFKMSKFEQKNIQ